MDGYGVKMVLNDQQVLILPGERKQIDVSGFAPSPAKKKAHAMFQTRSLQGYP